MGVPKFYRWISERYPCLSEVVKEYQIPEFDNLYLDMNGIIHICSHPNDDDPHFRITEEKIFNDIFHYIDFLFKMIKPKKVFFMAIDGVAPRAKMNQQRGRRFRTAREAELLEKEAISRGEILPTEARFDSNCITPGTQFMARLQELLRYFVSMKITTDKMWQNIKVYLSGHSTPGEGEHKIMDFIRYERSQPGYDPNTRHCLYGLDADLIMLGLCCHEPHFSLLREEVRFGKKNQQKRSVVPEQTTFHLLHLSLMREYLDFEFSSIKAKLSFPYDLEKIIDDWVMMGFLVGNDFIPHMPHLHIHQDALPELYKTYIEVLPTLNGYINEGGHLNLERFEKYLNHLALFDFEKFNEGNADLKYFESKKDSSNSWSENRHKNKQMLDFPFESLESGMPNQEIPKKRKNPAIENLIELANCESDDEEELVELEFRQHKRDYYMNKLDYKVVTPEVLKDQAQCYVTAIQWNLHYYYNGVSSWGWFYPHHYSPFISDVTNFRHANVQFELGKPFLPFEQLLSVLPAASKQFLPESYQKLMTDENSPLKEYYPTDFQTDLNGKQQNWEAVVLIPFINENLLLSCSKLANSSLSQEETERNAHGPHLLYTYCNNSLGLYKSSSEWFSDIPNCHALCTETDEKKFRIPSEQIRKGLLDRGNQSHIYYIGFPSFKHLKHSAELQNQEVKVFQAVSRGNNMMITIEKSEYEDLFTIAHSIIGKSVYVGWPHLKEAYVVAVANEKERYFTDDQPGTKDFKIQKKDYDKDLWKSQASYIKNNYFNRFGIYTQEICVLVFARHYIGGQYMCGKDGQIIVHQQWSNTVVPYAHQAIVKDIVVNSITCAKYKTIFDLYQQGTNVFMLAQPYYGCMGEVMETEFTATKGRLRVKLSTCVDISLKRIMDNEKKYASYSYFAGHEIASSLGISGYLVSRITGTILVNANAKESMKPNRLNIGLNLKFNRKNEEVPGYTKKLEGGTWLYSEKTRKVLEEYLMKFPQLFENLVFALDKENLYVEDIFSEENGKETIEEIAAWLKSQECTTAEHQSCSAEVLDEGIISAIESAVDKFYTDNVPNRSSSVVMLIKPNLLFSCGLSTGSFIPDINADYQLYDRVVNVEQKSIVPLGLKGTIVGINRTEHEIDCVYDILFDKEFIGGFSLNSSSNRRYRMSPTSLINITYGERSLQRSENLQSTVYLNKIQDTKSNFNANRFSGSPRKKVQQNLNNRNRQDFFSDYNDNLSPSQMVQNSQTNSQTSTPFFIPSKDDKTSFSLKQKQKNYPFYNKNQHTFMDHSNLSSNVYFDSNTVESVSGKSASGEFITPKVSSVHPTMYNSQGNADVKKESSAYKNTWEELKKLMPSSSITNIPDNSTRLDQYGRQVSLEALFQNAHAIEKQSSGWPNQTQQNINVQNPYFPTSHCPQQSYTANHPPNVNYCKELMNYVHNKMGASPIYKYSIIGPMRMHQAEVILPNNRSFTSEPSSSITEATEKAAETALLFLNANESRTMHLPPYGFLNKNDFGKIREPYLPNETSTADEYGPKQPVHFFHQNRNVQPKKNFTGGYQRNDARYKSPLLQPPEYFSRHIPSEKPIPNADYGSNFGKWKRMPNANAFQKPHPMKFSNISSGSDGSHHNTEDHFRNSGGSENMPQQPVKFIPFQVAKQTSAKKWEKEHHSSITTDTGKSSEVQKLTDTKCVNNTKLLDTNKTPESTLKLLDVKRDESTASYSGSSTQLASASSRRTPRKSRLAVNFQNLSIGEKPGDK